MVKTTNIKNFMLFSMLFNTTIISFNHFSSYSLIMNIIIVILFLFSLIIILSGKAKLEKKTAVFILIYILSIIVSSFASTYSFEITNVKMSAIRAGLSIINIYVILNSIFQNSGIRSTINYMFFWLLLYFFLTSFLIFIDKSLFSTSTNTFYLVGNKFSVCYLMLMTLIVYLTKLKMFNNKIFGFIGLIILLSISIFVSSIIDSGTFVTALLLITVLYFLPIKKILFNSNTIVITILVCGIFPFIYESFLSSDLFRFIVTKILHRNLDLTGRTIIYDNIFKIIDGHWLFGFGYGSSWEIFTRTIHYPNAQNGLMNMITEQGIISSSLFILLIKHFFNKLDFVSLKKFIFYIIYLYVLIILSTFEITLGISTLFLIIFIYNLNKEKGEENE